MTDLKKLAEKTVDEGFFYTDTAEGRDELKQAFIAFGERIQKESLAAPVDVVSDEELFFISAEWAENNEDLRLESPVSAFQAGYKSAEKKARGE